MKKLSMSILLMFCICFAAQSANHKSQKQTVKEISQKGKEANQLARASPQDSSKFSVHIEGKSNVVKINDKLVENTNDTIPKPNSINVSGEGNTVTVNQTDQKSEVIVTQKGANNHVSITQKK